MSGLNGTRQIIDLNAAAGDFIAILATGPVRRVIVKESPVKKDGVTPNVPQGLQYQDLTDNFVQVYQLPAADFVNEPGSVPQIELPDAGDASFHGQHGLPIGNGPSVNIGVGVGAATTLLKVKSAANATSVEVTQIY